MFSNFVDALHDAISTALSWALIALFTLVILSFVIGIPTMLFLDWKHEVEREAFREGYKTAARDAVSGSDKFYDEVKYRTLQDVRPSEFRFKHLRDRVNEKLREDIYYTLKISQDNREVDESVRAVASDPELIDGVRAVAHAMRRDRIISKALFDFVDVGKEPPACPRWLSIPDSRKTGGIRQSYEINVREIKLLQLWGQPLNSLSLYLVLDNAKDGGIQDEEIARLYTQELKEEFEYIAKGMEHDFKTNLSWQAGWIGRQRDHLRQASEVQEWYPQISILETIKDEVHRIEKVREAIKERIK